MAILPTRVHTCICIFCIFCGKFIHRNEQSSKQPDDWLPLGALVLVNLLAIIMLSCMITSDHVVQSHDDRPSLKNVSRIAKIDTCLHKCKKTKDQIGRSAGSFPVWYGEL